ncbi:MAG: carboxypeptidase-like regulatory domain-containing protein [Gemmatimonadaceae bacterium]|nr:carboxypeptidase-like regulatory domain-containing protein [Gemmatimonadaceae bacterium]
MPDRLPSLLLQLIVWVPPLLIGRAAGLRARHRSGRAPHIVAAISVAAWVATWVAMNRLAPPPYLPGVTHDPMTAPPEAIQALVRLTIGVVLPLCAIVAAIAFRRARAAAAVSLIASLSGCAAILGTDDTVCTTELRHGLLVTVRDSISGNGEGAGATLIARDGAYVDSLAIPAANRWMDTMPLWAAPERPGTYSVTVRKPGFADWEQRNVVIGNDRCHVIPVRLTARLRRAAMVPTARGA